MLDILTCPFVYPAAWLLKTLRRVGVHRFPRCRNALWRVGVFAIRDHFYEPRFDHRRLKRPLENARPLQGIDWNVSGQLRNLSSFSCAHELVDIPKTKPGSLEFYFNNGTFESGDAEYWYQLIRATKPRRIFEVGSGNSTLMAIKAIRKNRDEDPRYTCKHVCVEPYSVSWLEQTGVEVIREKVEDLAVEFFAELDHNDILFIDSSHVIRPQGDVLYEYLELLPTLRKGVIVHIHDIFTPRDYLSRWVKDEIKFWNEQYLLEAFLTENRSWEILGACNFLHHNHFDQLKRIAPYVTPDREPGSFYIRRCV